MTIEKETNYVQRKEILSLGKLIRLPALMVILISNVNYRLRHSKAKTTPKKVFPGIMWLWVEMSQMSTFRVRSTQVLLS